MYQVDEQQWQTFAANFTEAWQLYPDKEGLLAELNGDESLAAVISQVSKEPLRWVKQPVPALGNKSPRWCAKHAHVKTLKQVLMRMPW